MLLFRCNAVLLIMFSLTIRFISLCIPTSYLILITIFSVCLSDFYLNIICYNFSLSHTAKGRSLFNSNTNINVYYVCNQCNLSNQSPVIHLKLQLLMCVLLIFQHKPITSQFHIKTTLVLQLNQFFFESAHFGESFWIIWTARSHTELFRAVSHSI